MADVNRALENAWRIAEGKIGQYPLLHVEISIRMILEVYKDHIRLMKEPRQNIEGDWLIMNVPTTIICHHARANKHPGLLREEIVY